MMHGIRQAAKLAGISEALLALWLETGRVKPTSDLGPMFGSRGCCFDDAAVEQIRRLAEKGSADNGRSRKPQMVGTPKEFYTVAEVASLLSWSPDTIRREFENEPDVIKRGNPHPRGKRRRVTMRIPREAVERVKRRLARKK